MKARFLVPLFVCMLMTIASALTIRTVPALKASGAGASAEDARDKLAHMNEAAISLYGAAYSGNRQAAYKELQTIKTMIGEKSLYRYGSVEGWLALARKTAALENKLLAGAPVYEWAEETAQIRLAVDAMLSGEKALWLPYLSLLQEDLSRMKQAWHRQAGDPAEAVLAHLAVMMSRTDRIEAAALMAGDPLRAQELGNRVRYMDKLLQARKGHTYYAASDKEMAAAFDGMASSVAAVFPAAAKADAAAALPLPQAASPLQWGLFLCTAISAVLTWVGWRKYRQMPYGVKPIG